MFEIHRDLGTCIGLHLTQTPVGLTGVTHQHSGFQDRIHRHISCQENRMDDKTALAELIGARICHDLISPLGAIGNGIELLTMTGGDLSPEMALIAESAGHANARVRFFRIAFGPAAPDQSIDCDEINDILTGMSRGARLRTQWNQGGGIGRRDAKTAFLAILCLETAMPQGGLITVRPSQTGWSLQADGLMRTDEAAWAALRGPGLLTDISPSQVQFALLAAELGRQGRSARLDFQTSGAVLSF